MTEQNFDQDKMLEYFTYLDQLEESGEKGINIKILQKMQEIFGYIPESILYETSEKMGIPASKLYGAATFYHQFSFEPKGKHEIQLCLGTACYVKGSGELLKELEKTLGIKDGGMTEDGLFSIDTTRCVGACGLAPVIAIDGKIYGKVTPESLHEILDGYKEKEHE